jgi:hypothetical protein
MLRLLGVDGFGWKDLHVTNVSTVNPDETIRLRPLLAREVRTKLRTYEKSVKRLVGRYRGRIANGISRDAA